MRKHQQSIEPSKSDTVVWLANKIFTAFPQEVTGLKFYTLDCGCVYYQRVFKDGGLDPQVGIYRDADNRACEVCMGQDGNWRERVIDNVRSCNSKFQLGLDEL